jgi:hypothetical protein
MPILRKPFQLPTLDRSIREALDRRTGRAHGGQDNGGQGERDQGERDQDNGDTVLQFPVARAGR